MLNDSNWIVAECTQNRMMNTWYEYPSYLMHLSLFTPVIWLSSISQTHSHIRFVSSLLFAFSIHHLFFSSVLMSCDWKLKNQWRKNIIFSLTTLFARGCCSSHREKKLGKKCLIGSMNISGDSFASKTPHSEFPYNSFHSFTWRKKQRKKKQLVIDF